MDRESTTPEGNMDSPRANHLMGPWMTQQR